MNGNKSYLQSFYKNIFITFLGLLIAYSVYLLLESEELQLFLKPSTSKIVTYASFRIILGLYFFVSVLIIAKILIKGKFLWGIIITGLIVRVILIPSYPVLEDDYYRYLWDGAVTANFYNPYEYSPEDVMNPNNDLVPVKIQNLANQAGNVIERINHPHVRTIYPIVSQILFAAAYLITPFKLWSWKLILLITDLLLLFLFIKILRELKLPLVFVLFYWLNPVVIHEFFNAAHMDLPALMFVVLAFLFYLKDKPWLAVIALSLAVGLKLWPIIFFPLLIHKYWNYKKYLLKYTAAFAAMILLLYIPVLISNLDQSLGFIRYANKWVNNAAIYEIYSWLLTQFNSFLGVEADVLLLIKRFGVFVLYLVIYIIILRKFNKGKLNLFNSALMLVAVLYLISPTQFPWYYTWMIPFLVIRPMISLLLYPLFLPLYQLNYLSDFIVYIEHIPVVILFILETKGLIWAKYKQQLSAISN